MSLHLGKLLPVAVGALALGYATADADSYDPVTVGARAEGMGGAAIATARDLEAVPANPAGLLSLNAPELVVGGRVIEDVEETSQLSGTTRTPTFRHTGANLVGGAYPLTVGGRALVLAAAYHRPLELVTHFRGEGIEGGVTAWSSAVALALTPWLGGGLALNFWDGVRDYSHGLPDGSHLWWKSEYSGVNATFGVAFDLRHTSRPTPLRIGLAAHTPFDLGIDYHELTTVVGGPDRPDAWTYRVEMPWRVGLGAAWEPVPRLRVAIDVERRFFGDRRIIAEGAGGRVVSDLSASGEDLTPVRLGVEYRLAVGRSTVPLRLGGRTVPTLRADRRDGVVRGQAVGRAWTAGTGLETGRVRLDLAWSRSSYEVDNATGAATTVTTRTATTWMLQGSLRLGS